MKKAIAILTVLALGCAGWLYFRSGNATSGPNIVERAKQAGAPDVAALSAKLISADDLPPEGTRSLFDYLIAQNESLPYPFEKLVGVIQRSDPQNKSPLTLLIPQGRSLLKAQADFAHPRVLVGADFQAPNTDVALGLAPRGQLFLGFVENAHEIEVLSYNEAAGRFEFQLVQNYCENCVPRIVYARRAICTTCHQSAAPIFPQRPWNETNGQPEVAAGIAEAHGNTPYLGMPLANPLGVPERYDELTDVGNFIPATQRVWIDGCGGTGNGVTCRQQMLKLALTYLWNPAAFDDKGADAQKLRELQGKSWPANGIAVAESDLRNRDPLEEKRGIKGLIRTLFTPKLEPGAGAKNNEDLEAFDRLPKLPAELDPLTPRPPKRVLTANNVDGVFGLAAMITEFDFSQLEKAAGYDLPDLLAAVDRVEMKFFEPAVFSRVKAVNALLAALGNKTALDYCCLNAAEMSPPLVISVPPLQISEGSVLKHFEAYCFACHRGNPSKRLDFMAGATEEEVLASIKNKSEIRDALDWERYKGTDKENKLMPPADSHQRKALQEAAAKDPKVLDEMRRTMPALFDF